MKTIEEKLQSYIDLPIDEQHQQGFRVGFKKGIEFAERFIEVKDEIPLAYQSGDWDGLRSDLVLAKNKNGKLFIARTYEGNINGNKFCDWADSKDWLLDDIVEWRPITHE